MPDRWSGILIIAALGAACAKEGKPPAPPPSEGIQVLSPGTGERALLRYRVVKGARHRMEIALAVDIDAGGQGGPLPELVVTSELAIDDVLPDGSAKVRSTITSVVARDRPGSPIPADAMAQQTQLMRGLVLAGTLSPEGTLREMKADTAGRQLPPALSTQLDNLARSFEQVAMPLPPTPVGVGATWMHRRRVDQGGMKMDTATTIALISLDGDQLGFTSTTRVTGADQSITQGGTTIALSKIGGTGSGSGTVDLSRMVMTGELTAELGADMTAEGQTARMGMKMATKIRPAPESTAEEPPGEAGGDRASAPAAGSAASEAPAAGSAASEAP